MLPRGQCPRRPDGSPVDEHDVIAFGYLPEARLLLHARNEWKEVDLIGEVAMVEVLSAPS